MTPDHGECRHILGRAAEGAGASGEVAEVVPHDLAPQILELVLADEAALHEVLSDGALQPRLVPDHREPLERRDHAEPQRELAERDAPLAGPPPALDDLG